MSQETTLELHQKERVKAVLSEYGIEHHPPLVNALYEIFCSKGDVNERRNAFMQKCAVFVGQYDRQMVRDFFDYWTEMNEGGKKMRFEMQKVFDISRRLGTWNRNNKKSYGQRVSTLREGIRSTLQR